MFCHISPTLSHMSNLLELHIPLVVIHMNLFNNFVSSRFPLLYSVDCCILVPSKPLLALFHLLPSSLLHPIALLTVHLYFCPIQCTKSSDLVFFVAAALDGSISTMVSLFFGWLLRVFSCIGKEDTKNGECFGTILCENWWNTENLHWFLHQHKLPAS